MKTRCGTEWLDHSDAEVYFIGFDVSTRLEGPDRICCIDSAIPPADVTETDMASVDPAVQDVTLLMQVYHPGSVTQVPIISSPRQAIWWKMK